MTIYKVINDNKTIEFANQENAEFYCSQMGISLETIQTEERSNSPDMFGFVSNRLRSYRGLADQLVVELYTENTLLGITISQSDQMFDEYADVLLRLREGAFPTALYRLSQKTPSGFVTQELIDAWIAKIQSYL